MFIVGYIFYLVVIIRIFLELKWVSFFQSISSFGFNVLLSFFEDGTSIDFSFDSLFLTFYGVSSSRSLPEFFSDSMPKCTLLLCILIEIVKGLSSLVCELLIWVLFIEPKWVFSTDFGLSSIFWSEIILWTAAYLFCLKALARLF